MVEQGKALPGLELAWLGDGNNVLHSIIEAAGLMKFNVRVGTPQGYDPDDAFVARGARRAARRSRSTRDPLEAVAGADIVVTDTWVSMGQEHAHNKLAAMAPFQVNERADGARPSPTRASCTACPRMSARKSARACSKGRSRSCSTRRKTASTRRNRSCCGASGCCPEGLTSAAAHPISRA